MGRLQLRCRLHRLESDATLEGIQKGLNSLTRFEPWDEQTRLTVQTWLNLQGIECLLPERTAPDHSVTLAVRLNGFVHYVLIDRT